VSNPNDYAMTVRYLGRRPDGTYAFSGPAELLQPQNVVTLVLTYCAALHADDEVGQPTDESTPWALSYSQQLGVTTSTYVDLVDVTGDAIPDLVIDIGGTWTASPLYRDPRRGTWGFGNPITLTGSGLGALRFVSSGSTVAALKDVNNDGIPDYVQSSDGNT